MTKDREKTEKEAAIKENTEQEKHVVSETWAEDAIADLDDFIEAQGIYIRQ